ncbi:MAG: bifunctional hydroxymethylpyrimidine kinase/phosphomethylpyrimidine kinase [Cyanobacteria bacterium]|nr:bifunctional hydroxymethylpyrimidine kinase/phosphomethylpyrimidine kinase [Cyanobacteriota bacterium]
MIAALRRKRVVVFGDLIADEFVYGRIARVSREAPVLILEYDATEIVPGGAGNAANNVASLGGMVTLVSLVGRDEPGDRLFKVLPKSVDRAGLTRPRAYRTPVKTRILAGGIHSAKQQVVRIDRHTAEPVVDAHRKAAERAAKRAIKTADAVLISDYGSGLVQPRFVAELAAAVNGRVPILIDSRYALTRYRGLTACTPNESEVEQVLGVKIDDNRRVLERAGRKLLEQTGMAAVLITRGSRGMALFEPDKPTVHIPIFGSDQIADVTGAGDTVMATMTLALAAGGSFEQAARLANYAGGIVVMKRGTATVSAAELRRALLRQGFGG